MILILLLGLTGVMTVSAQETATLNNYQVTVYFTGNEGLALKSAPDINAGRLFMSPEGTSLHIDQVSGGWGHTTVNGSSGWVALRYTKIVGNYPTAEPTYGFITPRYYTVYNTEGEGLELRTRPTVECSTFGPMMDGTVIRAEAVDGSWVFADNLGHRGWANLTYLRDSSSQEISGYESRKMSMQAGGGQTGQNSAGQPAQAGMQPADNWAQAYINLLEMNRTGIGDYNWQKDYHGTGTRAVCLSDIYGDGIPELLFITAPGSSIQNIVIPTLNIVTWENGQIRVLYTGRWDKANAVGGYAYYYLFKTYEDKTLWAFEDQGDDGGSFTYSRFDLNEGGMLEKREQLREKYTYYGTNEFYRNENWIGEGDYSYEVSTLQGKVSEILMYSQNCGDFAMNFVAQNGCGEMTVDEAIAYLNQQVPAAASQPAASQPTAPQPSEPQTQPSEPITFENGVTISF